MGRIMNMLNKEGPGVHCSGEGKTESGKGRRGQGPCQGGNNMQNKEFKESWGRPWNFVRERCRKKHEINPGKKEKS